MLGQDREGEEKQHVSNYGFLLICQSWGGRRRRKRRGGAIIICKSKEEVERIHIGWDNHQSFFIF